MEQLLWILGFIPKFIWWFLFFTSFVVLTLTKVLNKLPGFYTHSNIIKIAVSILLIISVWMIGYNYNESKWQDKIQETKQQIEILDNKNKELSSQLESSLQNKDLETKEKTKEVIKFIERKVFVDKEVVKYLETCSKMPSLILDAHNKAAENK